jgi:hypothetical protein
LIKFILKEKREKKKAFAQCSGCQTPKGNGIKDGAVWLGCVYAVVFWRLGKVLCVGIRCIIFASFFSSF